MKRIGIFSVLLIWLLTGTIAAQYQPIRVFQRGQADLWAGVGLFPSYTKDAARMLTPPVNLGADWMASDQFSLGVSLGYSLYQIEKLWAGTTSVRYYSIHTIQFTTRVAATG